MRRSPRPYLLAAALALLAALLAGAATVWASQADPPSAPQVVRIYYEEIGDLSRLSTYDLFEFNNLEERYVLAAIDADERQAVERAGFTVAAAAPFWLAHDRTRFHEGYRTVDELHADMRQVADQYPDLTELLSYGDSFCKAANGCAMPGGERTDGFELLAMRVTNELTEGTSLLSQARITRGEKPVFFTLANLHARELTTPEIAMRWLALLIERYGQDPDVTWLLDWHELWIIPTANPDGHWIAELGMSSAYGGYPLMHRKNADRDADHDGFGDCDAWPSETAWQFGVDLNRNHSFAWAPPNGTSPCSPTYSGPSAASEPEVDALQELVRSLFADRRGPDLEDAAPADTSGMLFTLHNYSNLILRPFGFSDVLSANEEGLKAVGDKLAALNGYRSCRAPECLYTARGTTDDWAYGELGMPAFTFEIGRPEQGFAPPYAVIDSQQWPENRDAFLYAARIARRPYELIQGPDVVQLAVSEPSAGKVTLTALLDDGDNGGQSVAGAEYAVDVPFWAAGADPQPLSPEDTVEGSSDETFSAQLLLVDFTPGRHTIFVHGRDVEDNIGVAKAVYLDVPDPADTVELLSYIPLLAGSD